MTDEMVLMMLLLAVALFPVLVWVLPLKSNTNAARDVRSARMKSRKLVRAH